MFNSITLLSNKRSVHFVRPSGGCEQAKAMSRASFSPSKMRGTGGVARCLRFNTASTPPSANCCRTRAHMIGYVPKASEIFGSFHFGPQRAFIGPQEYPRLKLLFGRALAF